MIKRTHIAIADDVPSLSARELVACSGETFNKLFLQTKTRQSRVRIATSGWGRTVAIDKANCASFDIGPLSPKGTAMRGDVTLSGEGAYRLPVGYSRGELLEVMCARERARPFYAGVSASHWEW
jgi:hypothetical protein